MDVCPELERSYCQGERAPASLPAPSRNRSKVDVKAVGQIASDHSSSVVSLRTLVKRLSPRLLKEDSAGIAFRSLTGALSPSGSPGSWTGASGVAKRKRKGMLVVIRCLVFHIRTTCGRVQRSIHGKAHCRGQFFFTGKKIILLREIRSGYRTRIQDKHQNLLSIARL